MSFEPFDDFTATDAELARFAALLEEDPEESLVQRFEFFFTQDAEKTQSNLGFVPLILEHGFTCIGVKDDPPRQDLCYSVGFFYSFVVPELMIIDEAGVGIDELHPAVQRIGELLQEAIDEDEGDLDEDLDLAERAEMLANCAIQACEELDLDLTVLEGASEEFLEEYAYGYGWYFYRHFMDTTDVPILLARIGGEVPEGDEDEGDADEDADEDEDEGEDEDEDEGEGDADEGDEE